MLGLGGKRGFRSFLGWISQGENVTGFAPRRNCWEMRFLWDNLEFRRCLKEYFVSPGSPCGASSHPAPKLPQILKLQWIIPLGIPPISPAGISHSQPCLEQQFQGKKRQFNLSGEQSISWNIPHKFPGFSLLVMPGFLGAARNTQGQR